MSEKIKTEMGTWLADKMKAQRQLKDLSQKDVADSVGISRAQVANIESGLLQVSISSLMEISMFLDISLDEMKKYYRPSDRRKKKLVEYYKKKIAEIEAR